MSPIPAMKALSALYLWTLLSLPLSLGLRGAEAAQQAPDGGSSSSRGGGGKGTKGGWSEEQSSQYDDILARLWHYKPELPKHLLDHAVSVQGDTTRLQKAMWRALHGEPFKIALLGGSLSLRGMSTPDLSFIKQVHRWLELATVPGCAAEVEEGLKAQAAVIAEEERQKRSSGKRHLQDTAFNGSYVEGGGREAVSQGSSDASSYGSQRRQENQSSSSQQMEGIQQWQWEAEEEKQAVHSAAAQRHLTAQFRWGSPDPDRRVQELHGVEYRHYEETGHMCSGSHIKLYQMAVPAATPSYAERCVVQNLPDDVDLVIIDFAANDIFNNGEMSHPERHAYERLMRYALSRPSGPALLLFSAYAWSQTLGGFLGRYGMLGELPEEKHKALAEYYGDVQVLSARDTVWQIVKAVHDPFAAMIYTHDQLHPSDFGHRWYADIIISYLRDIATQAVARHITLQVLAGMPGAAALSAQQPDARDWATGAAPAPGALEGWQRSASTGDKSSTKSDESDGDSDNGSSSQPDGSEDGSSSREEKDQSSSSKGGFWSRFGRKAAGNEDQADVSQRQQQEGSSSQSVTSPASSPGGRRLGGVLGGRSAGEGTTALQGREPEDQQTRGGDALTTTTGGSQQGAISSRSARSTSATPSSSSKLIMTSWSDWSGGTCAVRGRVGEENTQYDVPCGMGGLKPPFFTGNEVVLGTSCAVGAELQQMVVSAGEGWQWEDEVRGKIHKYGWTSAKVGSELVMRLDLREAFKQVKANAALSAFIPPPPPHKKGRMLPIAPPPPTSQLASGPPPPPESAAQFSVVGNTRGVTGAIMFLSSYHDIGAAMLSCEADCECEETYLDGLSPDPKLHASIPFTQNFQIHPPPGYLEGSPPPTNKGSKGGSGEETGANCRIKVRVVQPQRQGPPGTRFKVVGIVTSLTQVQKISDIFARWDHTLPQDDKKGRL